MTKTMIKVNVKFNKFNVIRYINKTKNIPRNEGSKKTSKSKTNQFYL